MRLESKKGADPARELRQQILRSYREAVNMLNPERSLNPKGLLSMIMEDGGDLAWWRKDDYDQGVLAAMTHPKYQHAGFAYDPAERTLTKPDGEVVRLSKTEGKIFLPLIASAGQIVFNDTLGRVVASELGWREGVSAEPQYLRGQIARIRRKIGDISSRDDEGERNKYIRTVPTVGYSFDPRVTDVVLSQQGMDSKNTFDGSASASFGTVSAAEVPVNGRLQPGNSSVIDAEFKVVGNHVLPDQSGDSFVQPEIYPIWLTRYFLENRREKFVVNNVTRATGRSGAAPSFVEKVKSIARDRHSIDTESKPLTFEPRVFMEICREIGYVNLNWRNAKRVTH